MSTKMYPYLTLIFYITYSRFISSNNVHKKDYNMPEIMIDYGYICHSIQIEIIIYPI